jgi:tetratricopeptide (TPR) repeat protein
LQILEKANLKEGLGPVLTNLGVICEKIGEPNLAINYIEKSYKICERDLDTIGMSITLNSLGFLYNNQGNIVKALEYFFKSMQIREKSGDKKGAATSYNNIASVYQAQADYKNALLYFTKSLSILERLNLKEYQAGSLNNIGVLYMVQFQYDTALFYFNKSLKIYEELGSFYGIATTYNHLGKLYTAKNDDSNALKYYAKSLEIFEKSEEKKPTAKVLCSMANLLVKKGEHAKAIPYASKSFNYAQELGFPELIKDAANVLAKIHKKLLNHKEALKYYEIEVQMRDSLFNAETKKESVKKLLLYEFEKKQLEAKYLQDKKISELNLLNEKATSRKNKILLSLIFIALFLSATIFYINKLFKQRTIINLNKTNELKQKLLLSQMNPHFIFNSLDNIQSLIYSNQNTDAIKYLTKFSKLTRQILENSIENYITLSEEIEMLDNYLTIQRLLYNNKFKYNIRVDQSIEQENILIPPMLSQPFIENAIKHGLKHKKDDGLINIDFSMKNEVLIFEVTDNGSGLENSKESTHHKSVSTKIIKERLAHQNTKKSTEIRIENILENNIVMGVRVLFEIPYIYNN